MEIFFSESVESAMIAWQQVAAKRSSRPATFTKVIPLPVSGNDNEWQYRRVSIATRFGEHVMVYLTRCPRWLCAGQSTRWQPEYVYVTCKDGTVLTYSYPISTGPDDSLPHAGYWKLTGVSDVPGAVEGVA